jgi:hypothetical protein
MLVLDLLVLGLMKKYCYSFYSWIMASLGDAISDGQDRNSHAISAIVMLYSLSISFLAHFM